MCKQEKIRKYRYFRISEGVLEPVNRGAVLRVYGEETGRAGSGAYSVHLYHSERAKKILKKVSHARLV